MARYPHAAPTHTSLMRILALSGVLGLVVLLALSSAAVTSAITGDGTLGTTVTRSRQTYTIGGGTLRGSNLFQSFERFSVGTDDTATFTGPTGTANILSRVTGGQPSAIDGVLRSEIAGANLYLLNPSGVLFGPNATLDVKGSFHVSTADFLRFADGATFAAALGQESALTVASPTAFGFLGNHPAAMTIRGSTLQVSHGKAVSVVGGDVQLDGGTLRAPSGQIQLASVASPGEVRFSPLELAPDLQVEGGARLGQLALSQGALVDASGNGGGIVLLRSGHLQVDQSHIVANNMGPVDGRGLGLDLQVTAEAVLTNGTWLTTESRGSGRARDLRLTAGHLHLDHAGISSRAFAAGDSGNILVRVGTLTATGGAWIDSGTQGSGHGGHLTVTATDAIAITGRNSMLASDTIGTGHAGDITVEARQVTLTGGAGFTSGASSADNRGGGHMTITATEAVVISSSSVISVGPVSIRAPTVWIDKGTVLTSTFGGSDAADIVIAAGQVTLTDHALIASSTASAGRGGDIRIQGDRVTLTGGASIRSQTFGVGAGNTGPGGRITITATDVLAITGPTSGLFTDTQSRGPGGDITLHARELRLSDGATVSATSREVSPSDFGSPGTGPGGRITITATDVLAIAGPTSGLFTEARSLGPGGDITLHARELRLTDRATISATSSGAGDAGRLTMTVIGRFRSDRSTITAKATQANGGVIIIEAGQGVQLWDNSTITASVEGGPTTVGGNLTITAPFVVLEGGQEGVRIIAQATKGAGGRIVITSPVLLAEPTPADPTGLSRVSASSTEGGASGLVDIRAPVTTLSGAVAPLPQAFVNVAALLPARCAARLSGGTYSSLVVGGRGGFPLEPGGVLPSPLILDARLAEDAAVIGGQGRQTPPARGALLTAEERGFPRLRRADALSMEAAVRGWGCPH